MQVQQGQIDPLLNPATEEKQDDIVTILQSLLDNGIQIKAEDINNAGVMVAVQGQYNDDGNFELLTAGSGSTPVTEGVGIWAIESDFVIS